MELPQPPSDNPLASMIGYITNFDDAVKNLIQGEHKEDGLVQKLNQHSERFRRAIQMTAPDFRPFLNGGLDKRVPMGEYDGDQASDMDSEDEDEYDTAPVVRIDEITRKIQSYVPTYLSSSPILRPGFNHATTI